ncbi:MAG: thiamine pyrophosphate-dependent enzyme [Verrucomicrobiota bacterium]
MGKQAIEPSQALDEKSQKALLEVLWRSRKGDLREQSLIRQGKGWFHISGMGHEAVAAFALLMRAGDYAFPYYRDRAFCLQRGVSDHDLALSFYAKRDSSSGGRQLTGHFSDRSLNIWSHPSPVGAHLLPACGAAWGMQLDGSDNVVYASVGEAAARQGDFFEAVCFAKERSLPIIFVVEDNRIAISTSTVRTNPLAMNVLNRSDWIRVDGSDIIGVHRAGMEAFKKARSGQGPAFIWCDVERFSNHSSADDQRMYRAADDLETMHSRDPILIYQNALIEAGVISQSEAADLEESVTEKIRDVYRLAGQAEDPLGEETGLHLFGDDVTSTACPVSLKSSCRMIDAVNRTMHAGMDSNPDVVFFGEDIADPKGGVFNLTKGLSTKDPSRAVNSPLAESTILGVAVGLASYGKRPCVEIQFVDFIYPGWNQLVSNMATLRWRSFGAWKCPLIIYAPYGGYLPGGALWHSQAGEASFLRIPGIRVVVPSTPEDAAGYFWTAMHGEDPVIILLPKHLMWAEQRTEEQLTALPLGKARIIKEGSLLTLVTWGNCVELVENTLASMETQLDVELIDLRSISPWDRTKIFDSLSKTGRLLIVQEDNVSASVGQMIIAEVCQEQRILEILKSPPLLVSKTDVHVGFNPIYEYAALPDEARVRAAIEHVLSNALTSALRFDTPESKENVLMQRKDEHEMTKPFESGSSSKVISVPILGEGIRSARVVSILKEVGEAVHADDALCEVETDKAVFPIESDEDGVIESWAIGEDDEVEVGQELAVLKMKKPGGVDPVGKTETHSYEVMKQSAGLSLEAIRQLEGIVPATIDMTCRWESVRDARLRSKASGGNTISTATMAAWSVVQAMKKHKRFASYIKASQLTHDSERFDLGVAVALPNDVLETAVVQDANTFNWEEFRESFNAALRKTRHGEVVSKNRVSLTISSMGAYNVRSAIPVVVPPSVATLFIGAPYTLPDPRSKNENAMEVVSLVLTFDHRWVNGVGAAAFLSDVRKGIERFDLV